MSDQPSLPPNTTSQEDITTAGQRQINLIWERTQSAIALAVIVTAMATMAFKGTMPGEMTAIVFTIVGFYFGRTNHAAIGGIKSGKEQPYIGR